MDFLKELEELRLKTPRLYNINIGSENSDYCTHSDKNKNCYLLFGGNFNEDCMYGGIVLTSRDCTDCNYCEYSELCFESSDISHCYNCDYSQDLKNCTDCVFCAECVGCNNCFGCCNLRQQQYCFFNEKLSKEEYLQRIKEFNSNKRENAPKAAEGLKNLQLKVPHKAAHLSNCENCAGEYISSSKNCFECFDAHESQDCTYIQECWRTKDCVDMSFSDGSELCYEGFSIGLNTYNCNFCNYIRTCSDCEYCELCFSCKNCFGCVGLQNKEFCVLNVQYSQDEYLKKVAEIKAEMRANASYAQNLPTTYKLGDTAVNYWK